MTLVGIKGAERTPKRLYNAPTELVPAVSIAEGNTALYNVLHCLGEFNQCKGDWYGYVGARWWPELVPDI